MASTPTYVLTQADVGSLITVTVSYTDGGGTPESLTSTPAGPVLNVNDPPMGSVTIDGTATENETLTANTTGIADEDGLGPFAYEWRRGETVVASADNYALTQADVGSLITVTVSYTDGGGTAESLTSTPVGPVTNVNDTPTGSVTIDGTAAEDQTLTANTTRIADEDGLGPFAYEWRRGATVVDSTDNYALTQADVGSLITVTVSYTDGGGTQESLTSAPVGPVTNVNDAPTGSVTIDGTAAEDQTLTANTSAIADEDGLGPFSYEWRRGATVVASSSTYDLTQADVGSLITVTVSYTDGGGTAESLTSAPVGPVANENDAPTGSVTIDATDSGVQDEANLTANTTTIADEDELGAFTYEWTRGETVVSSTDTYVLTQADVGSLITVTVSYTDLQGTDESLTSTPVGPVAEEDRCPGGELLITNDVDGDGCEDCGDFDEDGIVNARDAHPTELDPIEGPTRRPARLLIVSGEAPNGSFELITDLFAQSIFSETQGDSTHLIDPLRNHGTDSTFQRFVAEARDQNVLTEVRRALNVELERGLDPASFQSIQVELQGADALSDETARTAAERLLDHVVYLVDRPDGVTNDLFLSPTNRFNASCEGGRAIVFVDPNDTSLEIAERVSHQAGHLFGLRHISTSASGPSVTTPVSCDDDPPSFEPDVSSVMDFDFGRDVIIDFQGACGTQENACTAVETRRVPPPPGSPPPLDCDATAARGWFDGTNDTVGDHSPRRHLLSHVLGVSNAEVPVGNWDDRFSGSAISRETKIARLEFPQFELLPSVSTLYDVRFSVVESVDAVEHVILTIPVLDVDTSIEGSIVAPATGYLRAVAKTMDVGGGEYDVQLVGSGSDAPITPQNASGLISLGSNEMVAVAIRSDGSDGVLLSDQRLASPRFPWSLAKTGARCLVPAICDSDDSEILDLDLDEDGRPDSQTRPPKPRFVPDVAAEAVPESDFAPALFVALGLLVSLSRVRRTRKERAS